MQISIKRRRQFIGMCAGIFIASITITILSIPDNENLLSLGPMNTGHENLECEACHTKAEGTILQQMQANILFAIGKRKSEADFGTQNVDTKKCQSCHERPNDRHPVHRFLEPRFAEVRKKINPSDCESCHREHNGVRLTVDSITFCANCHYDLKMTEDPLDIPHEKLVKEKKWTTCLQCHDFHGNHLMETATLIKDTIPSKKIWEYIKGGTSPYSKEKKYLPKKKPEDVLIENSKK